MLVCVQTGKPSGFPVFLLVDLRGRPKWYTICCMTVDEIKHELNQVTRVSKYLTLLMLFMLPAIFFYIGFILGEAKTLRDIDFTSGPLVGPEVVVTPEEPYVPQIADTDRERGILFVIRNEGGLCVYGGCWNELIMFTDSSYQYHDGQGTIDEGEVSPQRITELIQGVANINFDVLTATPFTDTCPIAYDGQKQIYTFYTELGKEIIDSCEFDLSENDFIQDDLARLIFDVHGIRSQ